jgi:uncharacterized damage-inducible protein DinB
MTASGYSVPIAQSRRFFNATLSVFREDDSEYAPVAGSYTVAQQVAHVAQMVEWFVAGGFRDVGFDLDFAAREEAVRAIASLARARDWYERAIAACIANLDAQTPERMLEALPEGPILPGEPRAAVVGAICEHTAHHRGSLAVYARLLGHVPPVPYSG